jgi:hypothetical protein
MEQQLLQPSLPRAEPASPVRDFFDAACAQGKLLWAADHIGHRCGCCVDERFCFFPDPSNDDPIDHFSGIAFESLEGDVVVTEAECLAELSRACRQHVQRHPEDLAAVERLLACSRLAR